MGVLARRPAGSARRGTAASALDPRAPSWGEASGLAGGPIVSVRLTSGCALYDGYTGRWMWRAFVIQ